MPIDPPNPTGQKAIDKKPRGFAALSPEARIEAARKGGQAVPRESRSFYMDREIARAEGRKGGLACPAHKRTFARDRALAVEAGRKGGLSRARHLKPGADNAAD